MPGVDDGAVIGAGGAGRIHPRDRALKAGAERGQVVLVDQRIVRGDAGLARIGQLAEGDIGDIRLGRSTRGHDHRGLAAKLQGDRDQIIGGRAHHRLAHRRAAGEQDVVERQRREGPAGFGIALHDRDLLGREDLRQHPGEEFAGPRRELGRFDHRPIAGGKRRRQRHHGQRKRIIPRRQDTDDAQRLIFDTRTGKAEAPVHMSPLGPHEAAQVAREIGDPLQGRQDLHHRRLMARAVTEIGTDRRLDLRPVGGDGAAQGVEIGPALR